MKIFDRYILKSLVGPFFFALLTIIFVLILQFFANFADRFIGKGIGFSAMVELIMLQSAWMVGLAAPMAVLIAVVMTFGSLTMTSEMTVFRASGVSLYRLMVPVLLAGAALSLVVERFNNVVVPRANYHAKALMVDIAKAKPTFGVTENAFSPLVDGYSILVRDSDERTGSIKEVIIYDGTRPDYRTVVTAEEGRIDFSRDGRYLVMNLRNGEIHEAQEPDYRIYRRMAFDRHRFVFESTGFGFSRSKENKTRKGGRELSAEELRKLAADFRRKVADAENDIALPLEALQKSIALSFSGQDTPMAGMPQGSNLRALAAVATYIDSELGLLEGELEEIETNTGLYNRYMAEYHKKYALSFACLAFVLVGVPLGILAKRGGFGIGAVLSLFFFVLYWVIMISGEKMAERGLIDPLLSIWMADVIIALIGIVLVVRLTGAVFSSSR